MLSQTFPFAVRLIGFSPEEEEAFDENCLARLGWGYDYFRLLEDNLQDPDLYIANGRHLKALITLADLCPSEMRPAMLAGTPQVPLPYPVVDNPIQWDQLFETLDELAEKRTDALTRLEAFESVAVPERRRRDRIDLDLTDPAEYEKMRSRMPDNGVVLVVDKSPALRDYLSDLLVRQKVPVLWVNGEVEAVEVCRREPVAVVMVNTSTPAVDAYRLCRAIKETNAHARIVVVLLVSKPFVYDLERARAAGADGFLNKPLASHHLVTVLKKFLPLAR